MFSLAADPFYIPNRNLCSDFSTFLPMLVISCLCLFGIFVVYYSHFGTGEVVPHFGIDKHSPKD